jgi:hypothetical protein
MNAVTINLLHQNDAHAPPSGLHVKVAVAWMENLRATLSLDGEGSFLVSHSYHNSDSGDAVDSLPSVLTILETLRRPEVQRSIQRHYRDDGLRQLLDTVNDYIREYGKAGIQPIKSILPRSSPLRHPIRPARTNPAGTLLRFPGHLTAS